MVKRKWFSYWYGRRMSAPRSKSKVLPFIETYGLDVSEFQNPPESFRTFNEFFYRKLKPECRPIDPDEDSLVFPADGRHLGFADLSEVDHVYAKGQKFCLQALLGSQDLADFYRNGSLLISRLCPVDYHRFHFPLSGKIRPARLINGGLCSVNPIALRKRLSILWENKRYLSFLENERIGKVAQLMIGATCVGSVRWTAANDSVVSKGQEFGFFLFGGSCVISLFPPNSTQFSSKLLENSLSGVETYGRMGQEMGRLLD